MSTSVTFFLLSFYSAVLCYPHGVFWTLLDKRVTIGHDLNLYCNESSLAATNCCTKHSTRRWFGGPNRELLYRNGISSYPSKYTSRLEDGGFYLTIHNVEVKDLSVSYACSVSIYEYSNILRPRYDIVFWTLVEKHVTIGRDLNLYCNESSLAAINCCPKHSTRSWFGGSNRELLYRKGISFYPSKYTSRLEDGGFYLTIHNLEVNDLNVSYTCSVSIYEYTNILRPPYDIVLPETSMSTEPSISGNALIGDDKIPYIIIILVIVMGQILVGGTGIAYYHRRKIKKLLMEKFCSNNTRTTSGNGKENINMVSVRSCTISENGKENIYMESGEVIEYQIKTENSDQKSFEEEPLIGAATTTENTDQKEMIEPVPVDPDQIRATCTASSQLNDGTINKTQRENDEAVTIDKRPSISNMSLYQLDYLHRSLDLEEICLQKAQSEPDLPSTIKEDKENIERHWDELDIILTSKT